MVMNKKQPKETMSKKLNSIKDVSTTFLYKMLSSKNFQDKGSQRLIMNEIKSRNEPITQQEIINISKWSKAQNH